MMIAGRELDALIAEKVMGRKVERWRYFEDGYASTALRPRGKAESTGVLITNNLPAYSTDIAAAWQVVERLNDRFSIEIMALTSTVLCSNTRFRVDMFDHEALAPRTEVHAATAPLAICLAALKAIGVEV